MKKIFFLLIISLVALSLTFCGQQKPAEEPAMETETETMESQMPDTAMADTAEAMETMSEEAE